MALGPPPPAMSPIHDMHLSLVQALQIQASIDASADGRAHLRSGTLPHADNPILVRMTNLAHLAYGLGVCSGGSYL